MKFMKLGSKPDGFQADGTSSNIRFVSSELAADVIINAGSVKFYLHKFPLMSKSNYLHKLISTSDENSDEINLLNFPGGSKSFEICAKFCYGMSVTLSAHNVAPARCAAEYLEMTEHVDKGNLIFKIEVFLNSSIFHSWKDSIIVLQTTKMLLPGSEDLKLVSRCTESIASKASADPANINWSFTYNRKLSSEATSNRIHLVPNDWWVEDISELDIDLYKRVILAVKSKGKIDSSVISEALRTYAIRWLPNSAEALVSDHHASRSKYLLETIVCLLPCEYKGTGCSCSFLLKLLKAVVLVGACESVREDLVMRIGLKLYEASVYDVMIPATYPQTTLYDVDLVKRLVSRFLTINVERDSWVSVGKLIDGYLVEIVRDPNLQLDAFVYIAESLPESARPIHDGLYRAIDMYLKEHTSLTKGERKKICGLMDVKKLTIEASMHAAQNERLPLRVVVRVLYFEQVRSHTLQNSLHSETNSREDDEAFISLARQVGQIKIKDDEFDKGDKGIFNNMKLLPSRSRRMFDKLWVVGKVENKSSETSGETKSSSTSSRNMRHSIS